MTTRLMWFGLGFASGAAAVVFSILNDKMVVEKTENGGSVRVN